MLAVLILVSGCPHNSTNDSNDSNDNNDSMVYRSCEHAWDASPYPEISSGPPASERRIISADGTLPSPSGDEVRPVENRPRENLEFTLDVDNGSVPSLMAADTWRRDRISILEGKFDDSEEELVKRVALLRNSAMTTGHRAVGALFEGESLQTALAGCTGTLVSCDLVITAAHCVKDRHLDGKKYWVFFQHTGLVEVDKNGIDVYCDNHPCSSGPTGFNDLALLRLSTQVTNIEPTKLGDSCDWDHGRPAGIVGFGVSSLSLEDFNLKREAIITLAKCTRAPIDERTICYNVGPSLSGTCNYDSGGPLLVKTENGEKSLIGVAIKVGSLCQTGQARYNNTTSTVFAPWIAEAIQSSQSQCAAISNPLNEIVVSLPDSKLGDGPLINGREVVTYNFEVGENSDLLLVSLNYPPDSSQTGLSNRFDLQLFKVSDDDPGDMDLSVSVNCFNKGDQVSVCRAESPPSGDWRAIASRVQGEDYYQLVATTQTH